LDDGRLTWDVLFDVLSEHKELIKKLDRIRTALRVRHSHSTHLSAVGRYRRSTHSSAEGRYRRSTHSSAEGREGRRSRHSSSERGIPKGNL